MKGLGTLVIIVGTNRVGARSRLVASQIAEFFVRELEVSVQAMDLGKLDPVLFSPTAYQVPSPVVVEMEKELVQSSAMVVVCPEYNGGMPGIVKLFIDLLPHPELFDGKPVWLVGVASGRFGGVRALAQLEQVLSSLGAYVFPKKLFFPGIAVLLSNRSRVEDPKLCQSMADQARLFWSFAQRMGSPSPAPR